MNTLKFRVLDLDRPTKITGYVYPRAVVEEAITELVEHMPLLGELNPESTRGLSLSRVAFKVQKLWIDSNPSGYELWAEIEPLNTAQGLILKTLPKHSLRAGPVAWGTVDYTDTGGIVKEMRLNSIALYTEDYHA